MFVFCFLLPSPSSVMGNTSSFGITLGVLLLLLVNFQAMMLPCEGSGVHNVHQPVARDSRGSGCKPSERAALLRFKEGIRDDPSGKLSSWANSRSGGGGGNNEDCCSWLGVGCDNVTGYVTKLDLSCALDQITCLQGSISPSLFSLKHLRYLDLSSSIFGSVPIPESLGASFNDLRHLNLSNCDFRGSVPPLLGNLSSLRVLDLSYGNDLVLDSVDWLGRLTFLEELYLGHVSAAAATNLFRVIINNLPRVSILSLPSCKLESIHVTAGGVGSDAVTNSSSSPPPLTKLDLSRNSIEDSTPLSWLSNISTLQYLDLSDNGVQRGGDGDRSTAFFTENHCALRYLDLSRSGYLTDALLRRKDQPFPSCVHGIMEVLSLTNNDVDRDFPQWVGDFRNLKQLFLRYTSLRGQIPAFLGVAGGLTSLRKLYIDHNKLSGPIPDAIANLSLLEVLYLNSNQLSGGIPSSIGNLAHCKQISLGTNRLNGSIPSSFGRLASLEILDLSSNTLTGSVPESLGRLSNLQSLKISYNSLSGPFTERHLSGLVQLQYLHLSFNDIVLNLKQPDSWEPPFSLNDLLLVSCRVGPRFPGWIRTQGSLRYLSLRNSSISDDLPSWIWSFSTALGHVDLSSNHITGTVPPIPDDQSGSFNFINLGSNRLKGPLPHGFRSLTTLFLLDNSFSGEIPPSYCDFVDELQEVDLSLNKLSGTIPECFKNSSSLNFINLSFNNFNGSIENLFGKLPGSCRAKEIRLSNNNFSGPIPSTLRNCREVIVLDMSSNHFTGVLPPWVATLGDLKALRLRSNSFSGEVPSALSRLEHLQILDLANNGFTGSVPRSFGNFTGMKRDHYVNETFSYENYPNGNVLFEMLSTVGVNLQGTPIVAVLHGKVLRYDTQLQLVTILDLSDNRLSGLIPQELGELRTLLVLNLSSNHLTGRIPDATGRMLSLLSLDLSRNSLRGEIPQSMLGLTSLSTLNLSYNNLSGKIPMGSQFSTFSNLSYVANPMLCGFPLKACRKVDNRGYEGVDEDNSGYDLTHSFVGFAIGFVVGFWIVWGTLLMKNRWRQAYFGALDGVFAAMLRPISLHRK